VTHRIDGTRMAGTLVAFSVPFNAVLTTRSSAVAEGPRDAECFIIS